MRPLWLAIALLSTLAIVARAEDDAGYDYDDDTFFAPDPTVDAPPPAPSDPLAPTDDGRPMLGIQMTVPPTRVQISQGLGPNEGVYVHRVFPGTAADDLDIQRGDVITRVNGQPITSMQDLRDAVLTSRVGQDVQVDVRRDGQDVQLGGSAYKRWPDDIPFGDLDPARERRFRELQQRRQLRRLEHLDRLEEQADALARQAAGALGLPPGSPLLGPDGTLNLENLPAGLAALPGGRPQVLPLALLALPSWRFDYAMAVAGEAAEVAEPAPVDEPAISLPGIDLDLRFIVASEAL